VETVSTSDSSSPWGSKRLSPKSINVCCSTVLDCSPGLSAPLPRATVPVMRPGAPTVRSLASREKATMFSSQLRAAEVGAFKGHHNNSCSINFSVDGELVVTGGDDAAPRVWEATTGREVVSLLGHTERVGFVSSSPDGSHVLSTSPDGTLRVWDVRPEGRRESIAFHDPSITADAIYLDGTDLLLSGSWSGAAGMWSRVDGTSRHELEGNSRLFAVTASPAADLAATGSLDGTITLWSITTGESVRRIQLGGPISEPAMSRSRRRDSALVIGAKGALASVARDSAGNTAMMASTTLNR